MRLQNWDQLKEDAKKLNKRNGLFPDRSWMGETMWDVMGQTTQVTNMLNNMAEEALKKAKEKENMSIIKNSYICLNGEDKYQLDTIDLACATKYGDPEAKATFRIGPSTKIVEPGAPKVRVTKSVSLQDISKVIFNYPATIVFWDDGTKTIVKCKEGDQWDPHAGISAAIAKKFFGNQVSKWVKNAEYEKVPPVEKPEVTIDGPSITEAITDVFLGGH